MEYILASKSPRRQELMKKISPVFSIVVSDIDETLYVEDDPISTVKNISYHKGINVAKVNPESIVISADTIVLLDNKIYGKPKDPNDAIRILSELSGKTHLVITGYSIFYKGNMERDIVVTEVTFNKLSDKLIREYVETKSPLDKAGAYGLQDNKKYPIVKSIHGSKENVIGFPTDEIIASINRLI